MGPDIIHDWNPSGASQPRPAQPFDVLDETLRDGLQSASVREPPLAEKLELLERMAALGVGAVDVGLPAASPHALQHTAALARHLREKRLPLEPICAARTVLTDVAAVAEASQRSGVAIYVYAFIGSSPIRQWAEGWDLDLLLRRSAEAVDFAVKEGLPVAFVTEDTTRSSPETLSALFRNGIEHGATRITLCDTVGHATPAGAAALVRWTRALLESASAAHVKVDWHGHNDRGLAVESALAALAAGAHRVHGCGLGIGERAGNTALDLLLLNLKLMGWWDGDLTGLVPYVRQVSKACHIPIPVHYPLSGQDAFRTASGIHASAILKAQSRGDHALADRVYSGVPAGDFGRHQEIEVGPQSGAANVRAWLSHRELPVTDELVRAVLGAAKASPAVLTEGEIYGIFARHFPGHGSPEPLHVAEPAVRPSRPALPRVV